MTGATGVHLLLWSDDRHDWLLPAPRRRRRPGQRHRPRTRGADVGAALRPADARAAGRGRRHPRRPVRPRPVLRRPRLLLAAGRAHPQPRHAAGGAAAGEPPHPRRLHHRAARRGQAHRRPARRLPRQRPALRRVPPDRRRAGRAAAGGDAGRPRGARRSGVRRGRRGGRRALRRRRRGHRPVRPGRRRDGRRRAGRDERHAAGPRAGTRPPLRTMAASVQTDRPRGIDRDGVRRPAAIADRSARGEPAPWSAGRSWSRAGCGAS